MPAARTLRPTTCASDTRKPRGSRPRMPIESVRTREGPLCIVRAQGESTLVEAVDFIRRNIDLCRTERIGELLINVAGVTAVPMPTLVDRFLAAEDWAHASDGR